VCQVSNIPIDSLPNLWQRDRVKLNRELMSPPAVNRKVKSALLNLHRFQFSPGAAPFYRSVAECKDAALDSVNPHAAAGNGKGRSRRDTTAEQGPRPIAGSNPAASTIPECPQGQPSCMGGLHQCPGPLFDRVSLSTVRQPRGPRGFPLPSMRWNKPAAALIRSAAG